MKKIISAITITLFTIISFVNTNIAFAGGCSSHSNEKKELECSNNDKKCIEMINKNKSTKSGGLNV